MPPTSLGEREIIDRVSRHFPLSRRRFPLGFNDDVSAFKMSGRNWLILKTDVLVGSTDVPPGMSLEQASRKAVVAMVSDFAAKGVQPVGIMISLGLPKPVKLGTVSDLAKGISRACEEYHCTLIGGDTGESTGFFIDCIGFGFADPRKIMRRDGARKGDVIAVTGKFGKSSAGLKILLSKRDSIPQKYLRLVNSVLNPTARLSTGLTLGTSRMVNSSMDSSDGLAWSLHEIARQSGVGMVLDKVPIDPDASLYAGQNRLSAEQLALYGGEEYELVLTISPKNFDSLKRKIPSLIRIGRVTKGRGDITMHTQGRESTIEARGWEHMVSKL